MKLTVSFPTRGRPDRLVKTVKETLPFVANSQTKLHIAVDDDDKPTLEVLDSLAALDDRIVIDVRPREDSRGEKADRALTTAPADVYLAAHDCAPILTPAFDQVIINAARLFPDGIGCVYSPMANANFPAYQAPTAKLVEKLGGIYSREYPYWFIDHDLDDICRMIGRYVFVDIKVHHSDRPGKTHRLRDLRFWTCYFDAMTLERRNRAKAIVDSPDFESPDWLKEVIKTWHPIVEARSLWLHSHIRDGVMVIDGQSRNSCDMIEQSRGEDGPPDAGYLRMKRAAEIKLASVYAELKQMVAA